MPPDAEFDHPAVRALDVQHVDGQGGAGIVLTDRLGVSEPTFVPAALLTIVGRCDGTRSLARIRAEAAAQLGNGLTLADVREVVGQLAERGLLLGPRFTAAVRAAAAAFAGLPARPARHAGSAGYPTDPTELR
ncbi:MAG: hypothetical protein JNL08_18360, partial [Planctomycetes bacterium]|nr:hypothetical protein [Planctomycetota bacterium]